MTKRFSISGSELTLNFQRKIVDTFKQEGFIKINDINDFIPDWSLDGTEATETILNKSYLLKQSVTIPSNTRLAFTNCSFKGGGFALSPAHTMVSTLLINSSCEFENVDFNLSTIYTGFNDSAGRVGLSGIEIEYLKRVEFTNCNFTFLLNGPNFPIYGTVNLFKIKNNVTGLGFDYPKPRLVFNDCNFYMSYGNFPYVISLFEDNTNGDNLFVFNNCRFFFTASNDNYNVFYFTNPITWGLKWIVFNNCLFETNTTRHFYLINSEINSSDRIYFTANTSIFRNINNQPINFHFRNMKLSNVVSNSIGFRAGLLEGNNYEITDHFATGTTEAGEVGDTGWSFSNGTISYLSASSSQRVGVVRYASTTTNSQACGFHFHNANTSLLKIESIRSVKFSVRPNQSTGNYLVGLFNNMTTITSDGVYFRYLANTNQVVAVVRNAGLEATSILATSLVKPNWDDCEIVFINGQVYFFFKTEQYDNEFKVVLPSNFNNVCIPGIIVYTTNSTSVTIDIDSVSISLR
ncbi:MAG: hypothetical protein NZZ41_01320 [Candidatus Dojkabacteria bacterium]|nr:hypothetical protein [Candidatus Dojkabacteria bacterium]